MHARDVVHRRWGMRRDDLFGALEEVGGLERVPRAGLGSELVEEDGVVFAVFDIGGEVVDPDGNWSARF